MPGQHLIGDGALANANNPNASNTAVGRYSAATTTSGGLNTGVGAQALMQNVGGSENTAVGVSALQNVNGNANIGIGNLAGQRLTSGSNNIYLATQGVTTATVESGVMRLGEPGLQTRTFISGVRNVQTGVNNGAAVLIDGDGQLGTVNSSLRYKEDVADLAAASATIMQLRPVTFRYRQPFADGGKPLQYGLIAEEVAQVMPWLAIFDAEGQPQPVKTTSCRCCS